MEDFERDLNLLVDWLNRDFNEVTASKLKELRNRLIQLRTKNLVKINHSVMELVCAKHLILEGYEVEVELAIDSLSCDLYGIKGLGTIIVEVETGFVPPENALEPLTYCKARTASKIARYSNHTNKFGLGTPPHYIMQIPPIISKPPRYRSTEELKQVKELCDLYYNYPPVSLEEIKNMRLHAVYIIDVDKAIVHETDPESYAERYLY